LGRIIKTGSASKDRIMLERSIALALRELASQSSPDEMTHDLVAYIALSLQAIAESIDESVMAWEKRGYWVKADRFRMEWSWAGRLGDAMRQSLLAEDWNKVALIAAQIAEYMHKIKVPKSYKIGTPWSGSWQVLKSPKQGH
jgi:hypothetical protein